MKVGRDASGWTGSGEKQLKKMATHGIVALFNAVKEAQGVRETKKVCARARTCAWGVCVSRAPRV